MTDRRVALVTGASRGIGRAIASSLVEDGFDLTLSGRNADTLRTAAHQLQRTSRRIETVAADMAVPRDVAVLAEAHQKSFGRIDVLVLSAGFGIAGPLDTYPMNRFDRQITVNVRSAFQLTQALLPLLRSTAQRARHGARVIAIASLTGVAAEPDLAAYGASKAALISLCESISVSEFGTGVSATALSPGYVNTDMSNWMHDRIDPSEMIAAEDLAELAVALTRLSRCAVVPNIPISRPGPMLWRA